MAIVKRFNKLLGLEKIDVLVDEKDKSRHIIISDMPESLPQGKSSFLIEVSPFMKEGIELQIDFIDSNGNSIYTEPVSNYLEGTSRTVSVEVYNNTRPGIATLIIVGELDKIPLGVSNFGEVEAVPEEFRGVYNVRLTKEVIINSAEVNVQPIKFYSSPRLTAAEKRFGTLEREIVSGEITSSAFSIRGIPLIQEPFSIFNPGEVEIEALGAGVDSTNEEQEASPPDGDIKGDDAEKEQKKQHIKKRSVRTNSRFKRSRRTRRRNSPIEYPYGFTIQDSNHEFTTKEIGGTIIFSDLQANIYTTESLHDNNLEELVSFNVVSDTSDENYPTHYTASIADLFNGVTAYVNTPFTKQDKSGNYRLLEMSATGKVHYTPEPSASYSITNIVSYANVTLSHLRTFSGEVFKAKVFVRAEGSFDDYKLLAEVPVESPELMINANSVGIGERTGYFISDTDKDTYWDLFGGTNGLSAATATSTSSYDNTTMLDSIMVSGSTSTFTDQIRFQLKDDYKFELTKNIDYTLSFNAIGKNDTDDRALLLVYVSGSSMEQKDNLYTDTLTDNDVIESSTYGKRLGSLEVELTDGGQKNFGLVSHNFNSDLTGNGVIQFRIIQGQWNLSDISVIPATDTGFSPSFVNFTQELPPELTHKRPETLEFLTEFYDINNNLADEVAVTTGSVFTGANVVITGDDNVISHNMFIGGDTTGSGVHLGGTSSTLPDDDYSDGADGSGFIRSIGYLGFTSASNTSLGGTAGFMIYSGSVLPNSGESYTGAGLELVGQSGSLKFRTNPSVFDVRADSFFVGKTTSQFISGSGEKIEISSSNYHLTPEGNVTMSGTITAESGEIGGWTIEDGSLTAGLGQGAVTMSSANKIISMGSGSTFNKGDLQGGFRVGIDTDGDFKFAVGSAASYIHADSTGVSIKSDSFDVTASVAEIDVDIFKLSANNLFISSSGGGFISAGNPRPTGITGTNKGFYVQGDDGTVLIGAVTSSHISFDGTNLMLSSSAFFLGGGSQFVSGSNGNVEISSSNFHLDNSGNVIMSGKVTANEGSIGGFTITSDALSSDNFLISGSSTGNNYFISSSNFNVKASGDVTASALDLTGGAVGGINVSEGEISVGSILKLKDSGQITGSSVLFSGGTIGGFTIDADEIKSTNVLIDSANEKITLGSANAIKLQGGGTDNFIAMGSKSTFSNEGTGTAGIIIGMDGTNPQAEFVKNSTNYFIFDDGIDIQTDTLVASGSSITLETPKFFLGQLSTQFVSGSGGNIEISSSAFHLTPEGNVTGSSILLGSKAGGNYLQFVGSTLSVRGDITADSISVPSAAATPSSSITAAGLLTTVSASIGGFDITSAEIKDSDGNLRLKSSGQITGSEVLFTGGQIAGWTINSTNLASSGDAGIRLNANGDNAEISVNSHTFAANGIQFGYNNGSPRFYAGNGSNNFLRYDTSNGVNIQTTRANISGSEITLETPKFFLGSGQQFVSGSGGNIEISSSNFHLTADGNVTMSGEITAAGGEIGGFTIGDDLSNSAGDTLKLKGSSGQITASAAQITGDITANTITANTAGTIANFNIDSTEIASSNNKLRLKANGQITASEAKITGKITATSGQIAGFDISGTKLQQGTSFHLDGDASATYFISSSDFQVTPSGDVSGSQVLFTGGKIANWVLASNRLADSTDEMRLDPTNLQISLKNHTFGQSGVQIKYDSGDTKGKIYVGDGANRFIKFDGTDVDIKTGKLIASGSDIQLSAPSFLLGSSGNYISGSGGSLVINSSGTTTISGSAVTIETPKFFFGKKGSQYVSGSDDKIEISSSKFHLTNDGNVIMNQITASNANVSGKMTATTGEIGSWKIGGTFISSSNLILNSTGNIETSDYVSDTSGWRISSANSGEAEFQNIKIRGTLSTAVFEKETVNAVGGQLYIANATVITGSTAVAATATTMSVVNVGGFVANEILSAKKVNATGFATEYILVQSSSRDNASSDKDFSGKLYVVRGYQSGSTGDSGSLGDVSNISQSYEAGQVIVSTGVSGSGFIRLNANPNDSATPYIDIVERTGSGVYDVDLKARLGDLSGLSSGLLYGNASPGFGLFTGNVFLQGAITAQTGSFTGAISVGTNGSMKFGVDVSGTNDGIFINSNNYWYNTGAWKVGGGTYSISNDSSGNIDITANSFNLSVSELILNSTTPKFVLGSSASSITNTDNTGVYMDGTGKFRVGEATSGDNFIYFDGSTIQMKSTNFDLTSTNLGINTSRIFLGTITALDDTSGTGFYVTSSGHFNIQNSSTEYIRNIGSGFELKAQNVNISGSSVTIETPKFFLGKLDAQYISGSNNVIEISSSKFHLQNDGDVIMNQITASDAKVSGDITADTITANTAGTIANFTIDSDEIKSSNNQLRLKQSGQLTASNYLFNGDGVITGSVTIGTSATILGTLSAGSIATPSSGPPYKSQITAQGYARFVSASIGGFDVTDSKISSTNNNIILSSSGASTISGSSVNIETPAFFLGATGSAYISGSGGNLQITSSNFHLTPQGNVTMSGEITAAGGEIGGLKIDSDKIYVGTGTHNNSNTAFYVEDDGKFSLKDKLVWDGSSLSVVGSITITSGDLAGVSASTISGSLPDGTISGSAQIASEISGSLPDGTVSGSSQIAADISGSLPDGTVSGSSQIAADISGSLPDGTVSGSSQLASDISGSQTEFSASAASSIAQTLVDSGSLAATVKLTGTGLNILNSDDNVIAQYSADAVIGRTSGTNSNILIDSDGNIDVRRGTAVSASFGTTTTIGPTSGKHVKITGTALEIKTDATTTALSASAAGLEMSGKVRATSGDIGGFGIASTEISSSGASGNTGLRLKSSGQITGSKVLFTGGKVGGWDISTILQGGTTFKLDPTSNGIFRLGPSFGPDSATSTDSGVFMEGDGAWALVHNANNRLYYDTDTTTLYIKAQNVTMSGSSVDITTPKFYLGEGSSQYISGSGGNIEISSSMFHLDPKNNKVAISGSITATDGNIGGFTINTNKIEGGVGQTISYTVTESGGNFLIDGVTKPALTFIVGNTYVFNMTSGVMSSHPFRIGTSANGSAISDGVTITSTSLTIVVTSSTPTSLYYFCASHTNMGSSISVTNPPLILDGSNGQITASAAKISGDITITGGDLAGVSTATISGSADEVSASLASRQTPFETQVVLSSGGMSLNKNDGTSLAEYGTTTRIGESGEARVEISNTALEMYDGAGSPSKRVELDSSGNLTLGKSGEARTVITDSDISLYSGQATSRKRVAIDNSGKIAIGGASGADVSVSSTDDVIRLDPSSGVTIFKDSSNKAVVDSGGLEVTQGGTSVASFGSIARIGDAANEHISASSAGITIKDGANQLGTFNAGGLTVGKTTGAHVSMSLKDISMYAYDDYEGQINKKIEIKSAAGDGTTAIAIGGMQDADVSITSTDNVIRITPDAGIKIFQNSTRFASVDATGLRVYNGSASNPVATFGTTAHVGRTDGTNNNVFVNSTSVQIRKGTQISASFGADTTIGSTIGKHIKINSTALEIKTDANTTALSASAAGLEMSGKVKATSGEVGGWTIDTTSLHSGTKSTGTYTSAGALTISSSGEFYANKFKIEKDGDAFFKGNLSAPSGDIGGWDINDKVLESSENQNIILDGENERISINSDTFGNTGVQLEYNGGNPKAFIGKTNGSFLKFDSQTDILQISSSTFELGSKASAFISASSTGTLEISSSKFHLQPDGDTIMQGKITATSGEIAGWKIENSGVGVISGSNIRLQSGVSASLQVLRSALYGANSAGLRIGRGFVPDAGAVSDWTIFGESNFASITGSDAFADIRTVFNLGTGASSTNSSLGSIAGINASALTSKFTAAECFIAGTKIWMEDGSEKNIEDVEVGEIVQSYNVVTKQLEHKKVTDLFTQEHLKEEDDLTVKLWFDNETFVHATIANPFIVEGKDGVTAWDPKRGERVYTWIEEKWNQLEIGDEILFNNGSTLEKTKLVKAEVYHKQIRTYDIEVEHTHTFFANGILTHNSGRKSGLAGTGKFVALVSGSGTTLSASERIAGLIGKIEADGTTSTSATLVGGYFSVEGTHNNATKYAILTGTGAAGTGDVNIQGAITATGANLTGVTNIDFAQGTDHIMYLGSTNQAAYIRQDGTTTMLVAESQLQLRAGSSADVLIYHGGTSWCRFDSSALRLGVNDTSPSYTLDVDGTIRATADVIAYSDRRVKENIITIGNPLEKIKQLRGVTYNRIDIDDKSKKIGLIAQEVKEILPEVVEKDNKDRYSVAYGNVVGLLIEGIKEQQEQIDELKKEVEELKNA